MDELITHKTGLGREDELAIKKQMVDLVKKDVLDRAEQNKLLCLRIESIRKLPKVNMISQELDDPYMNLKVLKTEIDRVMTDIHDTATIEEMRVSELAEMKKGLKILRYNMDAVESLLNYMEKDFKRKLRKPFNIGIGVLCIATGVFLYIWLN